MKKETLMCDVCEESMAKSKCSICGRDVCSRLKCNRNILLMMGGFTLGSFERCSICRKNMEKVEKKGALDMPVQIRQSIVEMLKN